MPFTNDWNSSTPIDHTQNKLWPTWIRRVFVNIEDRVNSFLYGFTSGETLTGFKHIPLITMGTGNASIPTGTGAALGITVFAKTIGTGPAEVCTIDRDGTVAQITDKGYANPAFLGSGTAAANTFLSGNKTWSAVVPSGCVMQWTTNSAPDGWLLCDGSAVSRSTYATLFSLIGTTFGVGDNSTTFNLPNLKSRIPVGKDASDSTFDTIGLTGGAKTHTLTTDEMPAHTHAQVYSATPGSATQSGTNDSAASSGSNTGSTGGGSAHNNLQPFLVLNYIIKS